VDSQNNGILSTEQVEKVFLRYREPLLLMREFAINLSPIRAPLNKKHPISPVPEMGD
jgi:hypothetical protein